MGDINDQALEWAKSNPTDPRAQDVMAKAWANQNPDDPRAAAIHSKFETPKQTVGESLYNKAADLGNSALESGKSALKTGVETLGDAGRGLVQGVTLGGSDETMAAARATTEAKPGSPEWVQLYRKYQSLGQASNKAAQERSPIAYGTGQVAGMIAPALLTMGASVPEQAGVLAAKQGLKMGAGEIAALAAKGAVTGAGSGAVASGLQSEQGKLIGATPEEKQALGADVVGGAITGGVVGGGLTAATKVVPQMYNAAKTGINNKISQYIGDSPFWRQVGKAKDLGEQGTNIYSQSAIQGPIGETSGLIHSDTNATKDLIGRIYNVDSKLGQKVGESIDNATNSGITVDLSQPMLQSVNTFKNLMEQDQTLLANPKAKKLYDTIFAMSDHGDFDASNLTPKEVQSLRNNVSDFADSIKQTNPNIANLGFQFQGQAGDLLKQAVPEYKVASERFEQFRRLVPETIISGATPVDISQVKLGNLKNDEAKLFQATKEMIQGSELPGDAASGSKETLKNFLNGINEFDKNEAQRVASGAVPIDTDLPKLINKNDVSQADAMKKLVQDRSDQSALLRQAWRVNPQESASSAIKGSVFGGGAVMNMANKYGLYKDTLSKPMTAPITLTKRIYNASEDQLRGLAQKMQGIPGIQPLGHALIKGLDNKDTTGVNAAIFSIMQNPQARILINGDNLNKKGESE